MSTQKCRRSSQQLQPLTIMKGWMDRVFAPGAAYAFEKGADTGDEPIGLVRTWSALVINTGNTPAAREQSVFGDPSTASGANVSSTTVAFGTLRGDYSASFLRAAPKSATLEQTRTDHSDRSVVALTFVRPRRRRYFARSTSVAVRAPPIVPIKTDPP
jgi:hypothetical protein